MRTHNKYRITRRVATTALQPRSTWLYGGALLLAFTASACRSSGGASDCAGGGCGQGGTGGSEPVTDFLPTSCEGDDCAITWPPTLQTTGVCPAGSNCGGNSNGLGIYVGGAGDSCFEIGTGAGAPRVCPEAFLNVDTPETVGWYDESLGAVQTGTTRVKLQALAWQDVDNNYRVITLNLGATRNGGFVDLERVEGDENGLTITYGDSGGSHVAAGGDLASLELLIDTSKTYGKAGTGWMKIEPTAPGDSPLVRYRISSGVRETEAGPGVPITNWRPLCQHGSTGQVTSFLQRKTVDVVNAQVLKDDRAVTLGCQTGAIDTCLDLASQWHYAPWDARADEPGSGDYLFATCLQAKRAAYFVGRGDPKSYTQDGTVVPLRDPFDIHNDSILGAESLEAIWGPTGAVCLNPENARHPELLAPPSMGSETDRAVPRCTSAHWRDYPGGKIATGKKIVPF